MARSNLVRSAAIGGAFTIAMMVGSGVASAAAPQYGGTATGGVTVLSGGSAMFTAGGFAPHELVTVKVTYCDETHTYSATAGADGRIAVRTAGAGPTSYVATGITDGVTRTVTASAVLSAACTANAVLDPTGSGTGGSGGTGGTGGSGASGGSSGSLPFTGFEAGAAAAIGLGAIGAGSILIIGSRRRRNPSAN